MNFFFENIFTFNTIPVRCLLSNNSKRSKNRSNPIVALKKRGKINTIRNMHRSTLLKSY